MLHSLIRSQDQEQLETVAMLCSISYERLQLEVDRNFEPLSGWQVSVRLRVGSSDALSSFFPSATIIQHALRLHAVLSHWPLCCIHGWRLVVKCAAVSSPRHPHRPATRRLPRLRLPVRMRPLPHAPGVVSASAGIVGAVGAILGVLACRCHSVALPAQDL